MKKIKKEDLMIKQIHLKIMDLFVALTMEILEVNPFILNIIKNYWKIIIYQI